MNLTEEITKFVKNNNNRRIIQSYIIHQTGRLIDQLEINELYQQAIYYFLNSKNDSIVENVKPEDGQRFLMFNIKNASIWVIKNELRYKSIMKSTDILDYNLSEDETEEETNIKKQINDIIREYFTTEEKRLYILRYRFDYEIDEIKNIMNIKKSRYHRILISIKEKIKNNYKEVV